jgi:D-alanine-D-alanine ligase
MTKKRILVLMYEDFVVPDNIDELSDAEEHRIKTELDVVTTLSEAGHSVRQLGVSDDVRPIREAVETWKPHIVFNLLEEFLGEAVFDHNIVSFLELLGVPYTGCSPRGMVITRDKALSKKLVAYHRIGVPDFFVVRRGRKVRRPRRIGFPLIVKSLNEEASLGIAQASLVHDDAKLAERVSFVHESIGTDAIVEQFIDGREIYVGVLGNDRLQVLPPLELRVAKGSSTGPLIATARMKHDLVYQKAKGLRVERARLSAEVAKRLDRQARRAFRALGLEGYARIDFRLDAAGKPYFLEANPNPDIAYSEEMAAAAEAAGLSFTALLEKIVRLGLAR